MNYFASSIAINKTIVVRAYGTEEEHADNKTRLFHIFYDMFGSVPKGKDVKSLKLYGDHGVRWIALLKWYCDCKLRILEEKLPENPTFVLINARTGRSVVLLAVSVTCGYNDERVLYRELDDTPLLTNAEKVTTILPDNMVWEPVQYLWK